MSPKEGLAEIRAALRSGAIIRADIEALLEFAEASVDRLPEPQYGNDAIRNGAEWERRERRYEAAYVALCGGPR